MKLLFWKRFSKSPQEIEAAQLKVAVARARADDAHEKLEGAVERLLAEKEKDGRDGA